jgi:hypothetical protein
MSRRRAVGVGQQLAPDAGSKSEEDGGPCILEEYQYVFSGRAHSPNGPGQGPAATRAIGKLKSPDEQLGKSGVLPVRHVDGPSPIRGWRV